MAGTAAAALFDFRFQPVAFEDAESIGAHARLALWRRRRGGAGPAGARRGMGHFAAIRAYHRSHGGGHWRLVGKSSRLRIRCRAVAAGMRASPAAAGSQGSAVWGAPAVRPDSLRAADARARAWVVAQLSINGFGMLLLGLLAFHGLRVSARTQPVVHGVAAGDGLRVFLGSQKFAK